MQQRQPTQHAQHMQIATWTTEYQNLSILEVLTLGMFLMAGCLCHISDRQQQQR